MYTTLRETLGLPPRVATSAQRYRNDPFNAKAYRCNKKFVLLVLSNWENVPNYRNANLILFNIVDETGRLEWTSTAKPISLDVLLNRSIDLILPYAPISHKFSVTMRLLLGSPNNASAIPNTECFEVLDEVSCTAENTERRVRQDIPLTDFRPRLRENVVFKTNGGNLKMLAEFDSVLPVTFSENGYCAAGNNSLEIEFYEGKDKTATYNKRLIPPLRILFSEPTKENQFKVLLLVTEDGSLFAEFSEGEFDEDARDFHCSPQIMNVIGRKIPTDEMEPNLAIQSNRTFGYGRNRTVIQINTTYNTNNIQRWRISLKPSLRTSGIGKKSYMFLMPVSGFDQSFPVPTELLEKGVKYNIKVEGLHWYDPTAAVQNSAFKVVCSKSTTWTSEIQDEAHGRHLTSIELLQQLRQLSVKSSPRASYREPANVTLREERLRLKIKIERATFHQATIVLSYDNRQDLQNIRWKIIINKTASATGPVRYPMPQEFIVQATSTKQRYEIPLQFQPGYSYRVDVESMGLDIPKETTNFRAELTISDIEALHKSAKGRTVGCGSSPCVVLYRNKSPEYFNDILRNKGGIMEVYDKDNSGDPASPINLQIKGLFFMATVEPGTYGEPMRRSAFGPVRICIPAEELLSKAPNLYFVDYYCMRGMAHYVTLVMTKPGSEADQYCQPRLMSLDVNDRLKNPFFFRDDWGQLQVTRADLLQVELLFTENLDIRGYQRIITDTVGKGSSTKGGIPKRIGCGQCNLSRHSLFQRY